MGECKELARLDSDCLSGDAGVESFAGIARGEGVSWPAWLSGEHSIVEEEEGRRKRMRAGSL